MIEPGLFIMQKNENYSTAVQKPKNHWLGKVLWVGSQVAVGKWKLINNSIVLMAAFKKWSKVGFPLEGIYSG